jgi:mannonate dehydratase
MPRNPAPADRNRRRFLKQSALGAATLGTLVPATAPADEPRPRGRSKIRIGTRISPAWLKSPNDNDLHFLKQIGVDYVDITLDQVKGYSETGAFTADALKEYIGRLADASLRIERANSLGPYYLNAHLGRPEGEREIDNLKRVAELLAKAEVPVFGIQACQATQHLKEGARAGWSSRKGRGGYEYPAFDQAQSQKAPKPAYVVTAEQLWKGLLNIYKQVMPILDGSKTRLAMHGNDPPLPMYVGSPQILCRFADFDRLFREVPSRNSGITFCVGTRYESGEDVFEGIRHFGKQDKLFHVHFRNVRGTLPAKKAYEEVSVDDGDLDMAKVLRTLNEVGYTGVIDYDHPIGIVGDAPLPKQYIGFAVGYMRGLLDSLAV